jgi:hypothetical protein
MVTPVGLLPESPAPTPYAYAAEADTLLTISGFGTMLYQARGLTQTLEIIKNDAQQVRDVNGVLRDISNPVFRKYHSKITCSDINAPPLDGIWDGMTVTVDCAAWLCYLTGRSGSPARTPVSGSSYILGNFTFYRPVLDMMVLGFEESFDEWGAKVGWNLDLEEI